MDFFKCSLWHEAEKVQKYQGISVKHETTVAVTARKKLRENYFFILPFQDDKGMHRPGQVKKGFVCSDCIHSPLGDYLRFERWKELRKPTKEKLRHFSANIASLTCFFMVANDAERNSGRNSVQSIKKMTS